MRTVLYQDHATKHVVRTQDYDVPLGSRQTTMDGYEESVWFLPEENQGSLRDDPELEAAYDAVIAEIRTTFAEFYPLKQAEWWEVIEQERNPVYMLGRWCHAAEVFREFAFDPAHSSQCYEVFHLLTTLLRASPAEPPRSFPLMKLAPETAREIIAQFHEKSPEKNALGSVT